MAKFMDVHHGMFGITPEALKEAHQADLDIQGEEGRRLPARLGGSRIGDGLVRVGSARR